MKIELLDRTEETVATYFKMVQDPEIRRFLPQKAATVAEALADFRKSQLPGAKSYGRTIYAGGNHVGDIWCYCIQRDAPSAMVSYCVFDKTCWGQGVATEALQLFLEEVTARFSPKTIGAFTFSANLASIRVLLKNGFVSLETFTEDGVESQYFQWENNTL